jgi:hypothetical protein
MVSTDEATPLSDRAVMPIIFCSNWTKFDVFASVLTHNQASRPDVINLVILLPSSNDERFGLTLEDLQWIPEHLMPTICANMRMRPILSKSSFASFLAFKKTELYYRLHHFTAITGRSLSVVAFYQKGKVDVQLNLGSELDESVEDREPHSFSVSLSNSKICDED